MPELLGTLACTIGILALAYFATRWVSGTAGRTGGARMGGLCVLQQLPVGRAERLVLVRLGERCLLLGVAQGGITLLAELSAEECARWAQPPEQNLAFWNALRKSVEKKK